MTLEEIIQQEPAVKGLINDAKSVKGYPGFCANYVFYNRGNDTGFKWRISRLVGHFANNPALRDSKAYDIVYNTVYDSLPDCQHPWESLC